MKSPAKKFFGTDGIRARVGQPPMTPEFVLKLGWAVGRQLKDGGDTRVLIGKDTRISGYLFESALQAGLSAAGVEIGLLGPFPTPGIAYVTKALDASGGIVISASHNPYYDNGIKIFSADATKLSDEDELEIEKHLEQDLHLVELSKLGKAFRITDAAARYAEFCKQALGDSKLDGIKIVLDCANGATYHIAPGIYQDLGAQLTVIGAEPNGLNINSKVGVTQPQALQHKVVETQADMGIAFDGDGDRLLMVDAAGQMVDGDQLLFVLADYAYRANTMHGGVVGTAMSNLGLELALKERDIPFERCEIGDRYVFQMLKKKNWLLGGETSGHIVCLDKVTTGDAIVASLLVLQSLIKDGRSLADAVAPMEKRPQVLINVPLPQRCGDATTSAAVTRVIDEAHKALDSGGRVLVRPSGTEPLLRIMVESATEDLSRLWAQRIAESVHQSIESA